MHDTKGLQTMVEQANHNNSFSTTFIQLTLKIQHKRMLLQTAMLRS